MRAAQSGSSEELYGKLSRLAILPRHLLRREDSPIPMLADYWRIHVDGGLRRGNLEPMRQLVTAVSVLFVACSLSGQTWQTSWEVFAKEVAPYPARSENAFDPEAKEKFHGKQVTWEGTVSKSAKYSESAAFVMEVTPQEFKIVSAMAVGGRGSGKVSTIQVRPKKGSVDSWKKVAPGTKVKFRAVLNEPIYMVLAFK
jgi:hypothetical protein